MQMYANLSYQYTDSLYSRFLEAMRNIEKARPIIHDSNIDILFNEYAKKAINLLITYKYTELFDILVSDSFIGVLTQTTSSQKNTWINLIKVLMRNLEHTLEILKLHKKINRRYYKKCTLCNCMTECRKEIMQTQLQANTITQYVCFNCYFGLKNDMFNRHKRAQNNKKLEKLIADYYTEKRKTYFDKFNKIEAIYLKFFETDLFKNTAHEFSKLLPTICTFGCTLTCSHDLT